MLRRHTPILWITGSVLLMLFLLGWMSGREFDSQVMTSLTTARSHIRAVINLRKDARKTNMAVLEKWLAPAGERAARDAEVRTHLERARSSSEEFFKLGSASPGHADAAELLRRDVGAWSQRVAGILQNGEGPEAARELHSMLEAIDDEAETVLIMNRALGSSLEEHVNTLQTRRQAVEIGMLMAAVLTLVIASIRWRKEQAAEERYRVSEQARMDLRRMAASLAHEVNNQLCVLQNTVALLKKQVPGDPVLDIQQESVDSMKQMANDFIAFGTAVAGPIERVDLVQLLRNVARPFAEYVKVPEGEPVWIEADRSALSRAFLNVIKNGVESGGRVDVSIERTPEGICVACKDAGPGIAPEHVESVGEPFFTTKARGTGLGLAVVRQIVGWHGGTFSLRNLPSGRGAVAELRFTGPQGSA